MDKTEVTREEEPGSGDVKWSINHDNADQSTLESSMSEDLPVPPKREAKKKKGLSVI